MSLQLRVARPVSALDRSVAMYRHGLGLAEIGRFHDHAGFDGVLLGKPGGPYHFEFTYCRAHPVAPRPTAEDLIVFYLPDLADWQRTCAAMLRAGFSRAASFNPYWEQRGSTFEDHDGYRVVLQQAPWDHPGS